MLVRRFIALDCLRKALPPIDEDQRLALLHAPFKGATLFGGELAKLEASPVSYSSRPYVRRGKTFSDRKGPKKPSRRGREQGRPMPTATITRPGQAKEGQPSMTASTPQDSNKRKVEPGTTPLKPLERTDVTYEGKVKVKSNDGVLPSQPAPVGGRLSEFVEGWKRITNDPYVLSIVAKWYRLLRVHPLGDKISPGARINSGHA